MLSEPTWDGYVPAWGWFFRSPDDQLFSPTVFEDVAFGPIYQGLPAAEVQTAGGRGAGGGAYAGLRRHGCRTT